MITPPPAAPPTLDVASARAAVERAGRERGPAAIAWLERARRLAPDDPTVALLLASAVMAADTARALAMLSELLDSWPGYRDAGFATVAGEQRLGRNAAAAARLGRLLAEGAAPSTRAFRTLADAVCQSAGLPGWIAVDSTGRIEISTGLPTKQVLLALDGVPVAARRTGLAADGLAADGRLLPPHWRRAKTLTANLDGQALLGSPVPLAPRRAAEGFVDLAPDGALEGWAWLPADADRPVPLTLLRDGVGQPILADDDTLLAVGGRHVLEHRRGLRVPAALLGDAMMLRVLGPDGRDLAGSPLHPGREARAARAAAARIAAAAAAASDGGAGEPDRWRPLDMRLLPSPWTAPGPGPRRGRRKVPALEEAQPALLPPIDIVIPVWRGADDLADCLASLAGQLPPSTRVVIVDDASTDAALLALIAAREIAGEVTVLRHAANLGFPAAANTGMRPARDAGRDVLLLNPDTVLPPNALSRLAQAAHAAADRGSVTPMTNDGTIASYSSAEGVVDAAGVARVDTLFRRANGPAVTEVPTGIGFCLYIRNDCLAATGLFRDEMFAQGYGEENDFCLRARHLGWRHSVATGVFVAHRGGRSFGAVKADLMARNTRLLNRLHPGYDAEIAAFRAADPLAAARRAVDRRRWSAGQKTDGAVVLLTHGLGGGVSRFVAERSAAIRAAGMRPIVLTPAEAGGAVGVADDTGPFADLRFTIPGETEALVALLAAARPRHVELHHFIGHRLDVVALSRRLGIAFDVVIHDSAVWCPRVTLTVASARYCGEPAEAAVCAACIRDLGGRVREKIDPAHLRARSRGWLDAARRVVVPCDGAARRIARQFPGIVPAVEPWEDDAALMRRLAAVRPARHARPGQLARVVVVGAIGPEKGYQVLLDCARDAGRRALPLQFVVVGHTTDDARLLESGCIFITGRFAEGEAAALVAAQNGQLGFVPSVIPETWCYALSALWKGGLKAACFALGAQAERVARSGAGAILPLGLPASRVNDFLLELASGKTAAATGHSAAGRG